MNLVSQLVLGRYTCSPLLAETAMNDSQVLIDLYLSRYSTHRA